MMTKKSFRNVKIFAGLQSKPLRSMLLGLREKKSGKLRKRLWKVRAAMEIQGGFKRNLKRI